MAKTGFGNFAYIYTGTWRGALHRFSVTGNHSGLALSATDAETFMTGSASPAHLSIRPFQAQEGIDLVEAKYYDGSHAAPIWEAVYDVDNPPPAGLTGTATAFGASITGPAAPLEVCVMVESNVGLSSASKPVFNKKFLRGAPLAGLSGTSGTESQWAFAAEAATAAASWGDGTWFGGRVYVSPSGKQANNWAARVEVGNHQVPRGRKRKTASSGSNILGQALGDALTAIETASRLV